MKTTTLQFRVKTDIVNLYNNMLMGFVRPFFGVWSAPEGGERKKCEPAQAQDVLKEHLDGALAVGLL